MAKRSEFADHICELLNPIGIVVARAMFGGYGLSLDGLTFAIIVDDVLYLKIDDQTLPKYDALGIERFKPFDDKPGRMNYCPVPPDLMDDPDGLVVWAREAFDVALRAKKPPKKRG
jgi:DNA transformation protein